MLTSGASIEKSFRRAIRQTHRKVESSRLGLETDPLCGGESRRFLLIGIRLLASQLAGVVVLKAIQTPKRFAVSARSKDNEISREWWLV